MYHLMSKQERNRLIECIAHGFAAERYRLNNPGASEDAAWAYAGRNWRSLVSDAIDFMAISDASKEAEESSKWN